MPKQLPIECRARYNMIHQIAGELAETFINGNRKDLVRGLEELEPKTAYAVLSVIMAETNKDTRDGVKRFLVEVA